MPMVDVPAFQGAAEAFAALRCGDAAALLEVLECSDSTLAVTLFEARSAACTETHAISSAPRAVTLLGALLCYGTIDWLLEFENVAVLAKVLVAAGADDPMGVLEDEDDVTNFGEGWCGDLALEPEIAGLWGAATEPWAHVAHMTAAQAKRMLRATCEYVPAPTVCEALRCERGLVQRPPARGVDVVLACVRYHTLALGLHARVGAQSVVRVLSPEVLRGIGAFL